MTRADIHAEVLKALKNERFALLWWDLELPGLGMATPNDVYGQDPERLAKYVRDYTAAE